MRRRRSRLKMWIRDMLHCRNIEIEGHILISEICPPHMQEYVTHVAVGMHSIFETVARSIESG